MRRRLAVRRRPPFPSSRPSRRRQQWPVSGQCDLDLTTTGHRVRGMDDMADSSTVIRRMNPRIRALIGTRRAGTTSPGTGYWRGRTTRERLWTRTGTASLGGAPPADARPRGRAPVFVRTVSTRYYFGVSKETRAVHDLIERLGNLVRADVRAACHALGCTTRSARGPGLLDAMQSLLRYTTGGNGIPGVDQGDGVPDAQGVERERIVTQAR